MIKNVQHYYYLLYIGHYVVLLITLPLKSLLRKVTVMKWTYGHLAVYCKCMEDDFEATLKIHKKFNFDWNCLKLSTQHKYMYMYQKKL